MLHVQQCQAGDVGVVPPETYVASSTYRWYMALIPMCCLLCAADDSVSFTKEDMLEGLAQQGYAVPGKSQEEDEDGSSMAGSSAAHSSQPQPIPAQAGAAGSGAAASPLLMVSPRSPRVGLHTGVMSM
jgi:hypothetical protein